ncbi:uncharacterized protein LOC117290611 [Asterias rubens]|uniref:uncharacterized protein LOC117290611 n=1 Tax=Asterias rubens TaxID=7604 RepID=UPI0014555AAE|nr:uncharacterized protein LOC117290611 [Asterias rubens]
MSVVYIGALALPLNTDGKTGFISVNRQNGERVITAHIGGISAIETATGELTNQSLNDGFFTDDENSRVQPSFIFREVTDGFEIARVIYDGNYTAKNFFVSLDKESIRDLQTRVKSKAPQAAHHHESKTKHPNNWSFDTVSTLPEYLQYMYNATDVTTVQFNGSWTSVPTFIRSMISLDYIKSQCNKLFSKFPSRTVSGATRRHRRGLLTYPKTLWCGKGTEAKNYDELGEDRSADTCCRAHDTCPYLQIEPMDSKLHLRNIAPYTISHCKCDKMFHNCLKRADTPVAKGVADVFFNKLKLKCFVTRLRKQCLETDWIGSCLRREKTETAVIRDARPFPEGKNFTKEEKALRRLKRRQLLEELS